MAKDEKPTKESKLNFPSVEEFGKLTKESAKINLLYALLLAVFKKLEG